MKRFMAYFVDDNMKPITDSSMVVDKIWWTEQQVRKDFNWIKSEYGDKGRMAIFAVDVRLYRDVLDSSSPASKEEIAWTKYPTSELIQVSEDALPF